MKLCEIYPSGCSSRGIRRLASTSRLLVASNDNRRVELSPNQTVEELSPTGIRTSQSSMGLDRLSLVPYGYIEAGVQDLSSAGVILLAIATLLIVGTNTFAKVADFLMVQFTDVFPALKIGGFLLGG